MQYIYTCATNLLYVNQRWLPFLVGSSVGCPLNCQLYPYSKEVDFPLSCSLSCPLYPYMEVVGSLICMAKFPWACHGQPTLLPTELPTFSTFGSSWLPTELPTVSIYGSSGQPNLHGKIQWAAHWQPTPLPTELPTVAIYESSGQSTKLPTELPTVSIYGSSRQPNLHGKIPMGSPRVAYSVAHVQPTGSKVDSSPVFFFVWGTFYWTNHLINWSRRSLYIANCSHLSPVQTYMYVATTLRPLRDWQFPPIAEVATRSPIGPRRDCREVGD